MFNIYDLLSSGHTEEELAAEFARALNDATARKAKEEEEARTAELLAAEEARKMSEAAKAMKVEELTKIFNDLLAFVSHYYPDLLEETIDDEGVQALAELTLTLLDLELLKQRKGVLNVDLSLKGSKTKTPTVDDVFADFFKTFGL
jgi:hypothetical protein